MTLLELERGFWLEGADFYRQHLSEDCVVLFPGVGVMGRAAVIEGIEGGQRWVDVEISNEHTLDLGPGARLQSYEVTARRGEEAEYRALASSVYVRRDDDWKLAFHQQSPLG